MPLPKQVTKFVSNVEEWQARYLAAQTVEEKLAAAQGVRLWLHGVYREVDLNGLNQPPGQRGRHRDVLENLEKILVSLDRSIQILRNEKVHPPDSFRVDCGKLLDDLRLI